MSMPLISCKYIVRICKSSLSLIPHVYNSFIIYITIHPDNIYAALFIY